MSRSAACLLLPILLAATASAAPRPNVVVILSDDMGYSDIGCYGSEIATPNLDRLAADGLRFTRFYNSARCCPTRASLLTGLHPHQAGIGHMVDSRRHPPGYDGDLSGDCVTLAEVLRDAGYGTYMAGKWHVTRHKGPEGPKHNWPRSRGFDRFYGTIHGAGSFFDPSALTRDDTPISAFADPEYRPETYYYTDAISDHAARFVAEHDAARPDDPLFLYVAYTAAHWPMHALPEDIAKYEGRYDGGYEPVRRARYARMKELGLIGDEADLSPAAADWDSVADKRWEARGMEVYAAMIDRMDAGIGKIVASLDAAGRLDDTLILYLQDNGGCAEDMGRGGRPRHPNVPRPAAPTLPPLAADALLPAESVPPQTRDGYPVRMGDKVLPGAGDTYVAYGEGWANVSNTPFRLYKHFVHEGGIATPLVACWPNGIARKGELERTPGHLVDLMATCVDLAGATYPTDRGGTPVTPMEGVSLAPLFRGEPVDRDALYWEHEGNRAIRVGDLKLVAKGLNGPWELYDLARDRSELHDLAAERPETVEALAAKWTAWAERCDVLPLGSWRAAAK